MAEPSPTGTAMTMATIVTMPVPARSAQMAYSPRRGYQPSADSTVAHSTWVTKVQVSRISDRTIRTLMRIDTPAAAVSSQRTMRSRADSAGVAPEVVQRDGHQAPS